MQTPLLSAICIRSLSGHSLIMPPLSGILPTTCTIPPLNRSTTLQPSVATSSWSRDIDLKSLKAELSWPLPHNRKTIQKICLCRRIISGTSIIPSSTITKYQKRNKSHKTSFPLLSPFVRTSHHRSPFTIDVVDKWNSIPEHIVSATSNRNFKLLLKKLFQSYCYSFLHYFISIIPCYVFVLTLILALLAHLLSADYTTQCTN